MKTKSISFLAGVLATVLIMGMMVPALADGIQMLYSYVNVSLNGEVVIKKDEPFVRDDGVQLPSSIIYNETTYLPVRFISELNGLELGYDEANQAVSMTSPPVSGDTVPMANYQYVLQKNNELEAANKKLEEENNQWKALYILAQGGTAG